MLNWTQWKLAEELNVAVKTISAWETDNRNPHPSAQRLLKILAERNGIIENERGYPEYEDRALGNNDQQAR